MAIHHAVMTGEPHSMKGRASQAAEPGMATHVRLGAASALGEKSYLVPILRFL